MKFQKKMKQRFVIAVSYIVLGCILVVTGILKGPENSFFSVFGFSLLIMGILRLYRHRKIAATPQAMRKQELAEKDEMTLMIAERARSWSFSLSVTGAGILVIVLQFLGYHEQSQPFAWYVCAMVVLYWISYVLLRKKY